MIVSVLIINTVRLPGDCDRDHLGCKLKLKRAPRYFQIQHDEDNVG